MSTSTQLKDGKAKWKGFLMSASCGEFLRIDGEAIEFEWNIFPGFTALQILQKIQNDLQKRNNKLRNSQRGSTSCQCSTILNESFILSISSVFTEQFRIGVINSA